MNAILNRYCIMFDLVSLALEVTIFGRESQTGKPKH